MFDWDRDYDSVVERRAEDSGISLPAAAIEAPSPWTSRVGQRLQGMAGRALMSMAVVLSLGAAGTTALVLQDAPAARHVTAALALPLYWLGLDDSRMPEELLAYDQTQYDNFRHGIARFSDADLLTYVHHAEASLAGDSGLAAFTRDALFLSYREMDRRGLARPSARLAAFDGHL